jgi:hypothetical protein
MDNMSLRDQLIEHLDHNRRQTSEQLADDIIVIVCEFLRWSEEASRGD